MKPHFQLLPSTIALAFLLLGSSHAGAQVVSRESDISDLRLGQRVMVDDGSCPAGQIKEVMGATLTSSGITRTAKCVQRFSKKK